MEQNVVCEILSILQKKSQKKMLTVNHSLRREILTLFLKNWFILKLLSFQSAVVFGMPNMKSFQSESTIWSKLLLIWIFWIGSFICTRSYSECRAHLGKKRKQNQFAFSNETGTVSKNDWYSLKRVVAISIANYGRVKKFNIV